MKSYDWKIRLAAASIIFVFEFLSVLALEHTPRNDEYYVVCVLFNFLIVAFLPLASTGILVRDLQVLNFAEAVTQWFGFLSYWYDIPIYLYNNIVHIITVMEIIRLLINRKGDTNDCSENYSRLPMVRRFCSRGLESHIEKE